jgi:hypothetical protein
MMLLSGEHPMYKARPKLPLTSIAGSITAMTGGYFRHRWRSNEFRHCKTMSLTAGKVGRPALPKKERRWKFMTTRISQDEFKEIVRAAKDAGMKKRKWIRTKLLAAARRA